MKQQTFLNPEIQRNFRQIHFKHSLLIFGSILIFIFILLMNGVSDVDSYIKIQETLFYDLNAFLSQAPSFQNNVTQIGNALILFSFFSIFYTPAPKVWEALIVASLISLGFSKILKETLNIPRPAQILPLDTFTIIGEKIIGFSSTPSGHSITIFTGVNILLLALRPFQKQGFFYLSYIVSLLIAFVFALSRVAVGAHFPLDVLFGSFLGTLAAVLGICLANKYPFLSFIAHKKAQIPFILIFLGGVIAIINLILQENIFIFYIAILFLIYSIYVLIKNTCK